MKAIAILFFLLSSCIFSQWQPDVRLTNNQAANIKFQMPNAGFARLTIFDLLGREIETLVNEKLNAGTYETDWDASKYSSGVYFYKLETSGFIETKKMLMIK